MPENGTIQAANREITLSATVVRRLARLHARAEGAQLAVNAANQALIQIQTALREALTEACEEEGVSVGSGTAPVDIDWRTGVVTVGEPESPPTPPVFPLPGPQPLQPGGPPPF